MATQINYNDRGHLVAFGVNMGTMVKTEAERQWDGDMYERQRNEYLDRARVHTEKVADMQAHPVKYWGLYGVMVEDHIEYHRQEVTAYVKLARKANRVSLANRYLRRHGIHTRPHV